MAEVELQPARMVFQIEAKKELGYTNSLFLAIDLFLNS